MGRCSGLNWISEDGQIQNREKQTWGAPAGNGKAVGSLPTGRSLSWPSDLHLGLWNRRTCWNPGDTLAWYYQSKGRYSLQQHMLHEMAECADARRTGRATSISLKPPNHREKRILSAQFPRVGSSEPFRGDMRLPPAPRRGPPSSAPGLHQLPAPQDGSG
jgi:hypothetical protein